MSDLLDKLDALITAGDNATQGPITGGEIRTLEDAAFCILAVNSREAIREARTVIEEHEWRPIETFDRRMFSMMTNGTPDCTEVVKYKGDIPDWATYWRPLDY